MKKYLFPIITIIICFAVVGTTFAWLVDSTDPIENTFTIGDVEITLKETNATADGTVFKNSYKMVPGREIAKDPKVTVVGGSEACWLFVKIEETANVKDFLTYAVDGWTELTGVDGVTGVYYRKVAASDTDQLFDVLTGNKVTVKTTVTKDMMDALTTETYPKLTFTAYAIQLEGFETDDKVDDAWNAINASTTTP